jgi:hypothetical protein
MQHASDRAPFRNPTVRRPGTLSPRVAFAVLLGLLAVVFGLGTTVAERAPVELNAPEISASTQFSTADSPREAPRPQPLSARRALARFETLDALRVRAYRTNDVSLFARYLFPTSELWELGARELRRMRRDGVTMRPRFHTRRLSVRERSAKGIVIRQVVRQDPRFYSDAGKDITVTRPPQLVTIDWTLKPVDGRWLISNSWIQRAKDLGKRDRTGRTK